MLLSVLASSCTQLLNGNHSTAVSSAAGRCDPTCADNTGSCSETTAKNIWFQIPHGLELQGENMSLYVPSHQLNMILVLNWSCRRKK
ncbi:hypothetical protein PAMP_001339 [Pampus punctatissimus]